MNDLRFIDGVLFDAGNTLVFIDPDRVLPIFRAAGAPVDEARFREAEFEARSRLTRLVGEGARGTEAHLWKDYFLTLFRECGVPQDRLEEVGERIREEHAAEHLWSHVPPGTEGALRHLRETGYRLGVVSNADGRVEALLERVGLRGLFEFVMDSHVEGMEKPDPEIFLAACRRLGVEPSRCLYVGDLYHVDVLGARRAGLRAILLDPLGRLDFPVERIPSVLELPAYLERRSAAGGIGVSS